MEKEAVLKEKLTGSKINSVTITDNGILVLQLETKNEKLLVIDIGPTIQTQINSDSVVSKATMSVTWREV